MNILIRTLQVGGLGIAIIGLFHTDAKALFMSGFFTHVLGDILFIKKNGL